MNEPEEKIAPSAEELFKSVGYEKEKNLDERLLISYKKELAYGFNRIGFDPINKSFYAQHISEDGSISPTHIRNGEMRAVLKQLEEAGIFKKETNLEHFSDSIHEIGSSKFAVVDNMPTYCDPYLCGEKCLFSMSESCDQATLTWMESEYKAPVYKLSRLEYDLLRFYNDEYYKFSLKQFDMLEELKEEGHFKNIPMDETIDNILSNCEVVRNDI